MKKLLLIIVHTFAAVLYLFSSVIPVFAQSPAQVELQVLYHLPQTNYLQSSLPKLKKDQGLQLFVTVKNNGTSTLRGVVVKQVVESPLFLGNDATQTIGIINAGAEKTVVYTLRYDGNAFLPKNSNCIDTTSSVSIDGDLIETEERQLCFVSDNEDVLGTITQNPSTAVSGFSIFGFAAILLGIGNLFFAYISAKK